MGFGGVIVGVGVGERAVEEGVTWGKGVVVTWANTGAGFTIIRLEATMTTTIRSNEQTLPALSMLNLKRLFEIKNSGFNPCKAF